MTGKRDLFTLFSLPSATKEGSASLVSWRDPILPVISRASARVFCLKLPIYEFG